MARWLRTASSFAAVVGTIAATAIAGAGAASASGSVGAGAAGGGYSVLDNAQKQALELHVIENFVPFAESFYRPSDVDVPDTGRYLGVGSGVTQPRGAGDIAMAYATLLTARPDQQSFAGYPRAELIDHTIRSIRHEAYTNVLSGAGYDTWGGNTWQASLETYGWAFAAHLLWADLDQDTRDIVRKILTGEANILITKPIASGTPGNTGAEDNGWNSPTPALAAVMFPDDPNRAAWEQTAIKLALNASSTAADATSDTIVDGHPLSYWMASVNLNDDLTMENHGFFNPIYQQVTHTNIDEAAIFYAQQNHPLPQAFSFRTQQIWHDILGRLVDENGDIIMPAGQDWASKDYQHLDYLSVMATRFRDADASVLESRALQTVAARQAAHPDGSILGQPDLGYESMLIKRMSAAWWNHEEFGPSPTPTLSEYQAARAATAGVLNLPSVDVVGARLPGATSYMSWDTERPMGLWVPDESNHLDDPVFTYYLPGSLTGGAGGKVSGYSCDCGTDRFSTAGVIGTRDFSMTSFPDGVTLLLDRGTGATFTYALEQIPGVTGDRPVYSAGGTGLGPLPGNWVDVAGRMGMIVLGGSGISAADAVSGPNTLRRITGSTGTGSGNRGAVLMPDVAPQTVADLSAQASQSAVPDGWSALTARAPDGTDRLAFARWSGPDSTSLAVTDPRGAPVPAEDATVSGDTATFDAALDAPASRGETLRMFVHADGTVLAHQDGEHRAVLTNPGDTAVHTTTTYVAPDGTASSVQRVLAAGETVTARVVRGDLTLAGSEYEHLLAARDTLTGLLEQIADWQRHGRISRSDAAQLTGATQAALTHLGDAIDEDTAANPDTEAVSAAVAAALTAGQRIVAPAGVPADIAAAIDGARNDASGELRNAQSALGVQGYVRVDGPVLPGQPITLLVSLLNRGQQDARHGVIGVAAPDGWTFPAGTSAFDSLDPGQTARVRVAGTVPAGAAAGTAHLGVTVAYRAGTGSRVASAPVDATVTPLYTLTPDVAALDLAAGGWNTAPITVHNNAARAIAVDLSAAAPDGVTATVTPGSVSVPAGGDATVAADVSDPDASTGSGMLSVSGLAAGTAATASVRLLFSDNLARNTTGAPLPHAFADNNQPNYPAALADDGSTASFWVSSGTTAGQGPTPEHPIALGVDLGHPVTVGSVTMAPRVNYGPKAYDVQVSTDGQSWTTVAEVASVPNATLRTTFDPVTARYVRLSITADYDRTNRNVQVAEVEVRPS